MGIAMEILSGRATNPGATITTLTANTGDTFTVRSFPFESAGFILTAWTQQATDGVFRIRSARLHDQLEGIRLRAEASVVRPLLPLYSRQRLYPQDNLGVQLSGDAAAVVLGAFLTYYTDAPGISARLATWSEVLPRIANLMGAEQAFTTSATAGDYGGSQALTADFDTFKRNVDYALLGYLTDTAVGLIGVTGGDTGNLRVGGPGINAPDITSDWFVKLSVMSGLPCIPIINAANVGATTVDAAHTTASVAINVTLIFAELSGAPASV